MNTADLDAVTRLFAAGMTDKLRLKLDNLPLDVQRAVLAWLADGGTWSTSVVAFGKNSPGCTHYTLERGGVTLNAGALDNPEKKSSRRQSGMDRLMGQFADGLMAQARTQLPTGRLQRGNYTLLAEAVRLLPCEAMLPEHVAFLNTVPAVEPA